MILKITPSIIRIYKLGVNCDSLMPYELNTIEGESHLFLYKINKTDSKLILPEDSARPPGG